MEKYLLLFLIALVCISCKNAPKNVHTDNKGVVVADSTRYPWVPFSLSVNVDDDYKENSEAMYEIYDRKRITLLAKGAFQEPYKIECLLPYSENVVVFADGVEVLMNQEKPTGYTAMGLKEEDGPRITKMYWGYWNGEKYVEIEEDCKTKLYDDLSFVVETKDYEDGETINITIKHDDGHPLFDDILKLDLDGIVLDDKVVFEKILNEYKLNLDD